ncbi:N-acetyl-D-Glu racemase DgcA [Neomegalonema perideroedes]|uniref:N-acetyl-D-Glu racemase DgcA n=1 Tax=Neomegalonema perideroedes TaxID=217219 RepID=UPI0003634779|nr:N-acetyl-D-Glu racemase DgcA [Neomegalonema perideroedes]
MPQMKVSREVWPAKGAFVISRGAKTSAETLLVEVGAGEMRGRGECTPYKRYGESLDSVEAALQGVAAAVEAGAGRAEIQSLLPAGAARNALDCALWDLEAKQAGRRVWDLLGLPEPRPVETAFTLSLGTPDAMGEAARAARAEGRMLLKLKLGGDAFDLARVAAAREASPEARLVVDANEAWDEARYLAFVPAFADLGVALIEQPFPAQADDLLRELPRPTPVYADESCHDRASLARLKGLYDGINVKLDKAGGLTEALALKAEAQAEGFGIMVGCMLAGSLAMAPALILAQGAEFADLDGPLLLAKDRAPGLAYRGAWVGAPEAALWG